MRIQVKEVVRRNKPWDVARFVAHLPDFVRLFFRLLGDRRVHWFGKAVFLAAVGYLVSPLDFLPDLAPVLGQVDDLTVLTLACRAFLSLCPQAVVAGHVAEIDRTGEWAPFGLPKA